MLIHKICMAFRGLGMPDRVATATRASAATLVESYIYPTKACHTQLQNAVAIDATYLEPHKVADIVENIFSFLHGLQYRGEVVVHQNHVCSLFGDVGASHTHGHADVGHLQRGGVVHSVARHGHDFTVVLESLHNSHLLRQTTFISAS